MGADRDEGERDGPRTDEDVDNRGQEAGRCDLGWADDGTAVPVTSRAVTIQAVCSCLERRSARRKAFAENGRCPERPGALARLGQQQQRGMKDLFPTMSPARTRRQPRIAAVSVRRSLEITKMMTSRRGGSRPRQPCPPQRWCFGNVWQKTGAREKKYMSISRRGGGGESLTAAPSTSKPQAIESSAASGGDVAAGKDE